MDPHDTGSLRCRSQRATQAACEALLETAAGERADHRLARESGQHRQAELTLHVAYAAKQSYIMLDSLAKTKSRINRDALARHTGLQQGLDAFTQEGDDLKHHVLIMRLGLHVLGRALHVHHAQAAIAVLDDIDRAGRTETVNVID